MEQQQSRKITCRGCGAKLAPALRYCLYCYHPVADENITRPHIEAVRAVDTTRRADPTTVFLPDEHEALLARARRRKRLIAIGAIALLIVVVGAMAFDTFNRRRHESERAVAREKMARRELNLLAEGLERFKVDVGRYPTDEEGIGSLTRKPVLRKSDGGEQVNYWMGPYVDGVYEVDPWGNDYVYRVTNGGEGFELFSYGPEGEAVGSRLQVTSSPSPYN